MKWQCYLETEMGLELVKDEFPDRFSWCDAKRAFEGRYGCKTQNVSPAPTTFLGGLFS
tara:strand:+ start:42 stop:215 length:174 start_codon:yes stop_codon:yes gene_type:complete